MSFSPKIFAALTAFVLVAPTVLRAQQQAAGATIDMTPVAPESVGFSAERLERLHAFIQSEIDQKQLAGAVTLLAPMARLLTTAPTECGTSPPARP